MEMRCENEADSSSCYRPRCSCGWEDRWLVRGHWSCLQKMSSSCQDPGSWEEWGPHHEPCLWSSHEMSRISDDCTHCWPLSTPDVDGYNAMFSQALFFSPRRPPTRHPRRCPGRRPHPPHQRRPRQCPGAHQRHSRISRRYPPWIIIRW